MFMWEEIIVYNLYTNVKPEGLLGTLDDDIRVPAIFQEVRQSPL